MPANSLTRLVFFFGHDCRLLNEDNLETGQMVPFGLGLCSAMPRNTQKYRAAQSNAYGKRSITQSYIPTTIPHADIGRCDAGHWLCRWLARLGVSSIDRKHHTVITAQAGSQNKLQKALIKHRFTNIRQWIPACAGMTAVFYHAFIFNKII
uniref:Uncharacterized protein n=1 Tax=Conchiformibius kuhniae TaxID=211502 RepID=A0A8T9MV51_9NEIS|nr:hypothetical protein LVJ77_08480 [Conchiformibius kuhniae]